jgi:hypothetical protein
MAENGELGGKRQKGGGSARRFLGRGFLVPLRLACAVYCLLLTVLLLVPDPFGLLRIERSAGPSGSGVHFLLFAVLGGLVLASRLPLPHLLVTLILVGYAVTSELLQSFFPPRTVEMKDIAENILGLGVAYFIGWVFRRWSTSRGGN